MEQGLLEMTCENGRPLLRVEAATTSWGLTRPCMLMQLEGVQPMVTIEDCVEAEELVCPILASLCMHDMLCVCGLLAGWCPASSQLIIDVGMSCFAGQGRPRHPEVAQGSLRRHRHGPGRVRPLVLW